MQVCGILALYQCFVNLVEMPHGLFMSHSQSCGEVSNLTTVGYDVPFNQRLGAKSVGQVPGGHVVVPLEIRRVDRRHT